jgi:hypothetical protein
MGISRVQFFVNKTAVVTGKHFAPRSIETLHHLCGMHADVMNPKSFVCSRLCIGLAEPRTRQSDVDLRHYILEDVRPSYCLAYLKLADNTFGNLVAAKVFSGDRWYRPWRDPRIEPCINAPSTPIDYFLTAKAYTL